MLNYKYTKFLLKHIGLSLFIFFAAGCGKEKPPDAGKMSINPGVPRHWDFGDRIRNNPLPTDVADGYLEFAKSPGSSYGVTLAHQRLSARNHEHSDVLFYVHTGVARFQVGTKSFTAANGDLIYIPRGVVYSAESMSNHGLELLTVYTPPLDPSDIIYHEAAERVIPAPSGKKLRVKIDTISEPPSERRYTEEDFYKMKDYEEMDEEK